MTTQTTTGTTPDPMPLAARVSIGRGAASVLGVLAVLASAITVATGGSEEIPLPAVLVAASLIAGGAAITAVGPWDEWLSERGQEVMLLALPALPSVALLLLYLRDDATNIETLLFLAPVSVLSALTLPLRRHVASSAFMLPAAAAAAALRGAFEEALFVLLATLATATLGGLAKYVLGAAYATSLTREREAEAANRALMAVVDAARTATTSETQDVLDAVVHATERLQSDTAGVYLLGADGNLRYGATFNIPDHLLDEVFPPDRGMAGQALREDRTIVTNDYLQHARSMPEYRDVGLRAALAAPIRVDDEPAGVLVAGRYRTGGYEPAAVSAFELLADHAGRALALSRAIDADRRLLERLKSLHALQEDFVATVSHELRTPLTVIDGLAETLERHTSDLSSKQVEQLLSRLRANTTTLTTIVTSLLEAARLDRGLIEVEDQAVDLWDLVEGCVARLTPILHDHELDLDLDDAVVRGDSALLERVVDNLLTNAQRHTPPGTTVRIETRLRDQHCVVTISDDGPGIPPDDLATITERFTRGGDLHTRTTRGLGLGLALADQILKLHGTRLHVSSPPSTGAHFRFRLRLAA